MEPLVRTIDLPDMIAYAGATWDWHRLHYDPPADLPGPVVDGQMLGALMAEQLLDNLGPRAFIAELSFRFTAMVFAADTVTVTAEPSGEGAYTQEVRVGDRLVCEGTAKVVLR